MSSFRIANIALCLSLGAIALAACSSDDKPTPSVGFPQADAGGSAGTGGSTADASPDAPPDAPTADADAGAQDVETPDGEPDAAPDAPEEPGVCGDQVKGPLEECDDQDFGTTTCQDFGFSEGSLTCTQQCSIDASGCSGVETCFDGLDNDGDGLVDCGDDDCTQACSDPCAAPEVLADPSSVTGNTTGHKPAAKASCLKAALQPGPTVVYQFQATNTGVMDVMVVSAQSDFNLSIRSDCADVASESACVDFAAGPGGVERLVVPSTQGQTYFLIVEGSGASEASFFDLDVSSRPVVCGDGHTDPPEECDDGALDPGDGCSSTCTLELAEVEPNDTIAQANPFSANFVAQINPAGDIDVMAFQVTESPSSVYAEVFDLGDGACAKHQIDSYVEVLKPDGTVLAFNDDNGIDYCSKAMLGGLEPGTYYVRVSASGAAPPTWAYRLAVFVDPCGNGIPTDAEECDDGNKVSGDGCSATCTKE